MKNESWSSVKNICHSIIRFTAFASGVVIAVHAIATEPTSAELHTAQSQLFSRLNVAEAWKATNGSPDLLIGVIDNGFDFYHPDMRDQLVPGYYYAGGYHSETFENIAHGTRVASMIVAKDDQVGICGLAPKCRVITASQGTLEHKLLSLQRRFFEKHPKASLADFQTEIAKHREELAAFGKQWSRYQVTGMAAAIRYLVVHDVRVINVSGLMSRSSVNDEVVWREIEEAFAFAAERGVVIVLAAGNTAAQTNDYPGTSDNVLIVGACTNDGKRWETETEYRGQKIKQGSNYGDRLSVMAPVEQLAVCQPHDEAFYHRKDGPLGPTVSPFEGPHSVVSNGATSLAAPIVTSLVALARSANPALDAQTTIKLIKDSCDDLGKPGVDEFTGHGMVNFGRTMELAAKLKL